ncbi:hypothetical protein [Sphingopyxis sp. 113P3]|uniref:hypothetical protein n=1 Tax=Sphingopyxis sp. (strain 113P3) TaxID=292913 RepID=UPI000A845E04|nr:hypothetical protein [Sphingopyxis sp. 113P3]
MTNSKQIATGNIDDFLPHFVIFAHFMTNSQIMAARELRYCGRLPLSAGRLSCALCGRIIEAHRHIRLDQNERIVDHVTDNLARASARKAMPGAYWRSI